MNILIAEDEEGFRSLLQDALSIDPTVELSFATNGLEAWWLLGDPDRRFDLGIFDIKMPCASGLSLLQRVRSSPRYRNLPVILCSGNCDRESVVQSGHLRANHYLVKPFKIEALLQKVNEAVAHRHVASAVSRRTAGGTASPLPHAAPRRVQPAPSLV